MLGMMVMGISVQAASWQDSPQLAQVFRDAGVNGTFVLYDVKAGRLQGHNRSRADIRYVPASTFKIPNSLIGLITGVVQDVDEVLPWGGGPALFPQWERDMPLREAIVVSNVPLYRGLARRIGKERMQHALEQLDYGNRETGEVIDRFWLDGPLAISAVEQTQFLARLAQGTLPVDTGAQQAVREILRLEQGDGWSLHGKTGWQNAPDAGVGWWVGWVQKGEAIYTFAFNFDMRGKEDADKRVSLGKACLQALGVL